MPRPLAALPAILLILSCATPATAAVFCVDTATELQNALTTAASNGEDDQVQIVQGTYVGNFVYATATEEYDLAVQGGWTAGCVSREINPANTVLDGNERGTVLALSASALDTDFILHGITAKRGTRGSGEGGGLYVRFYDGSLTATLNNFENNSSAYGGGAYVNIESRGVVSIITNSFSDNEANGDGNGGGAAVVSGFYGRVGIFLLDNNFLSNTAGNSGGGAQASTAYGSITVSGNHFSQNVTYGYGGGGLRAGVYSGDVKAAYNKFIANLSQGDYGYGGGAILSTTSDGQVALNNNSFHQNLSHNNGGGAFVNSGGRSVISINSNSIQVNSASRDVGGILVNLARDENNSSLDFRDNLLWKNTATGAAADLWIDNDPDNDFIPTPITLLNNNFDQSPTGFYSTLPIAIDPSNFNAVDPMFVDADNGDLRLKPGSPMIDAGNPDTPNLPATDLAGNPRVIGGIVDIGAYESFASPNRVMTVVFDGAGSGRVTSTPAGIDCDENCSAIFPRGTPVTLTTESPAFTGWSGPCSGTDACDVTMDQARTVTATFNLCTICLPSRGGWRATLKP